MSPQLDRGHERARSRRRSHRRRRGRPAPASDRLRGRGGGDHRRDRARCRSARREPRRSAHASGTFGHQAPRTKLRRRRGRRRRRACRRGAASGRVGSSASRGCNPTLRGSAVADSDSSPFVSTTVFKPCRAASSAVVRPATPLPSTRTSITVASLRSPAVQRLRRRYRPGTHPYEVRARPRHGLFLRDRVVELIDVDDQRLVIGQLRFVVAAYAITIT